MAGIVTDVRIPNQKNRVIKLTLSYSRVCTAFLVLSLIKEGYTVYANADASGCQNQRIADDANDHMRPAGVNVWSGFAVVCDLMRDWRNTPGSAKLLPYFDK